MTREPFIAWPGSELRRTLPLCVAFALLFILCYGCTSWLTGRYEELPVWALPFESRAPFIPSMAVIYLTITPSLMLAPFVFRRRSELAPLVIVLSLEVVIATICFLLFPQTTAFTRGEVTGWARIPFAIADAMNLEYNQFPSLHVAFACTAAWAYAQRSRRPGRVGFALWSIAVALSTFFMHEHHLVDIAGGALLAFVMMRFVYPILSAPSSREVMWAELCAIRQCLEFSQRHRRYFVIFLAIYLPSLLNWRRYRAVRFAFGTAQWIDDLLDGDRLSAREPLDVIDQLLGEIELGSFSTRELPRLTGALLTELRHFEGAEADFVALVRTMRRDRERVLAREIWTEETLREHHRATFSLSVNLLLKLTRCRARADDVPALVDALSWCSVFRDLNDDLGKGLINVPAEVWESGALEQWRESSRLHVLGTLETSARELAVLSDARARRILGVFQRSIAAFARRTAVSPASRPSLASN